MTACSHCEISFPLVLACARVVQHAGVVRGWRRGCGGVRHRRIHSFSRLFPSLARERACSSLYLLIARLPLRLRASAFCFRGWGNRALRARAHSAFILFGRVAGVWSAALPRVLTDNVAHARTGTMFGNQNSVIRPG